MKAIKKNFPAIISIVMIFAISAFWIVTNYLSGQEFTRQIGIFAIGVLLTVNICFLKEKHLYSAALPVYLITLGTLLVQLFYNDLVNDYGFGRYLILSDSIVIYTAALLPFTFLFLAKKVSKYNKMSLTFFIGLCIPALIPAFIVIIQPNTLPALLMFLVLYIVAIKLGIDKRITIHPAMFILPVIFSIAVFVYAYFNSEYSYFTETINTILTRGKNDPYGSGWIRTVLDSIITSTPFIGETSSTPFNSITESSFLNLYDYSIIIVLAKFGWLAFIGLIACIGVFFASLFHMVKKTNQSAFSKYTSFTLALWLFLQALLNIVSIFMFSHAFISMPFITNSRSLTIINYIMFAIILMLYLRRDEETEIKENEYIEEDHFSFKNIFKVDNDDEIEDTSINFYDALSLALTHINLCKEINDIDPEKHAEDLAYSYYYAARIYECNSEYTEEASAFFDKSIELFEKLYEQEPENYYKMLTVCYKTAGNFFVRTNNYECGEKLLLNAIKILEGMSDTLSNSEKRFMMSCYYDMGHCCWLQDNDETAEKYYLMEAEKLREYTEENPDEFMENYADAYKILGDFYSNTDEYEKAQAAYKTAIDISFEFGEKVQAVDYYYIADCYDIAAKCAAMNFKFGDALKFYSYSRKMIKKERQN